MTKSIDPDLQTQASAQEQAPTIIVTISGWGGQTYRWVNSDANVTYGGNAYTARALTVGDIAYDSTGLFQEITVTIDNTDLALSALLDDNDPSEIPAATLSASRIFLDDLTVSDPLCTNAVIVAWDCSIVVAFQAAGLSALLSRQTPARMHSRLCPRVFKGTECTYSGGATYCSASNPSSGPHEYTWEACESLNNELNFGGFKFLRRRYR